MPGRLGRGISLGLEVILVLAVLIAVNFIADQHFFRADLTEDKEYTISQSTRRILGDLDDVVSIRAYFSEDLPPRLEQNKRRIADVLDEYRSYGAGNINVEWIDPAKDPQMEQQLRFLGIPQIQAQILEKDQLQVVNVYMGIGVHYGEKRQGIPVVQDTYSLEYDLTSAILRVTLDEDKVLGFLTGEGVDLETGFQGIRQLLGDQYSVQTVNLDEGRRAVPDDIHTLIIPGPQNVTARSKYEIDQYLMRGGRIIFLIDAIRLDEQGGLRARPVTSGLEDLLASYGVRVQKSLVRDNRYNSHAAFSQGFIQYTVPYPFWPKVSGPFLSKDHITTSRLESLVLPWPAPIKLDVPVEGDDPLIMALREEERGRAPELDGSEVIQSAETLLDETVESDEEGEGSEEDVEGETEEKELVAYILARSSPYSELQTGQYDIAPDRNALGFPRAQLGKSYIMATALDGKFKSYYAGRPVPAVEGGEAAADSAAEAGKITESLETQIIVLGSSFFVQDNFLAQFPENAVFFQNAVDWLSLGPELIGIRSRGATDRPLKETSDGAKAALKTIVTLGPALIIIAFGLVRFALRRRKRAAVEATLREVAGQEA
jgi:ABC-type uncharacterized transport system involved in gliding motility auxiliary subunit